MTEIIYNKIADLWVYVPMAHDWGGKFLLPVLVDEPLEIVRRDIATGWITSEQAYDPVADTGWLIEVGLLGSGEALAPPMMIDARPFHFLHFAAPEPEDRQLLRLEIEAEADGESGDRGAGGGGFSAARPQHRERLGPGAARAPSRRRKRRSRVPASGSTATATAG